ncbi:AAA family ATPase [bacterium]|nr:AAA family ATPase [bacterium]
MAISRLTSILHILKPQKYIHLDQYVARALGKLWGEHIGEDERLVEQLVNLDTLSKYYEKLNEFFLHLQEKFGFQNLCDVYWFLQWIDEKSLGKEELGLKNYFQSKGFQFRDEQIFAFYNALKTKGFVILAGLSGTGKTKIAQLFAELIVDDKEKQICFLSVRPDWRDSTSLIGYYNPITVKYQSTPLLELILNAEKEYKENEKKKPYFLILDEMNLAHVEYYFADFLSVLESGREDNGFTREKIKLHSAGVVKDEKGAEIPENIALPPNIYVIGTVNIDETTYMFSPKVLDRAFTIEFRDVDLKIYPTDTTAQGGSWENLKEVISNDLVNDGKFYAHNKEYIKNVVNELGGFKDELSELNNVLLPYDLGFGYRVVDEIALFLKNAKNQKEFLPELKENVYKDLAVLMKVLPKFHGPKGKVEAPLIKVLLRCFGMDELSRKAKSWEDISHLFKEIKQKQVAESQEAKTEGAESPRDVLTEWDIFQNKFKYPLTAKKVLEMLARLYETGFTSFM